MMGNQPADSFITGPSPDAVTFPEPKLQSSTSSTSRIENTKIEAEVYCSLNNFASIGSTVSARTPADQQLVAVRNWFTWLDVVRKRFARDESTFRMESGLAAARTSAEALKFCLTKGVANELGIAIDSARKHFSTVGSPSVNLVHDPEDDHASYLVIEIQVRGTVRDNVMSHRRFANEMAKSLGTIRGLLRLHYDII
jgi:hypothetical protein